MCWRVGAARRLLSLTQYLWQHLNVMIHCAPNSFQLKLVGHDVFCRWCSTSLRLSSHPIKVALA